MNIAPAVSHVLEALSRHGHSPRRCGAGWECRCPAHDDQEPSLCINTGKEGRALVYCQAGCNTKEVLAAVGLTMRNLMPEREPGGGVTRKTRSGTASGARFATASEAKAELKRLHGPVSGEWTYLNADGEPVGLVLRWDTPTGKKRIRPVSRNGSGWVPKGMPTPRPLYALPDLLNLPPGSRIFITEGEKAADAVRACELSGTTSPHGAKSATKADWSPLDGHDVVILPDHDDAGERYADEVAALARKAGARSVRIARLADCWPDLPTGGDAADVLELMDGDARAVRESIEALAEGSTPDEPDDDGSPVLVRLSDVKPEEVRWLWPGRLPRGRLSLLVGRPGEGKSLATIDAAARVSTGSAWPDDSTCERGSVLLVAAEDDPADTIRPRLDAHGADPARVHLLTAVRRRTERGMADAMFTLADLDPLAQALDRIGDVRLVIVDPIGSYIGGRTDAHRDNEVRAVLAPLAALAQRTGAAVLMIAHIRKSAAGYADDLVLGSRAFTGVARSVLHLMRDPDDDARRLLLPGKMNLSAPAPGLAFAIGGEPARVQWEQGPVATTAEDVLARMVSKPRGGSGSDADGWLRDVLDGGPKPAREIQESAKADGFAWRTIQKAKARIGVVTTREGFGAEGCWMWHLPKECSDPS